MSVREGRAFLAPSGQWSWEITELNGTPVCGGGGYDTEDEAWQDMYAELTQSRVGEITT